MGEDLRIIKHPILGARAEKRVVFTFDGREVEGIEGEPIAVALQAAGLRKLGAHERTGEPRGLFCGIGHCFGCRVTVDGEANVRSCITPLSAGMEVLSQGRFPEDFPEPRPLSEGQVAAGPKPVEDRPVGTPTVRRHVDVVVVGGGPAGLSAALAAANQGAKVVVLDEQPQPGGRLLSQVHENPRRKGEWFNGPRIAADLVENMVSAGVEFRGQTQVWGLWPRWLVSITGSGAEDGESIEASAVIVATGAAQACQPFPGWTLPGVISVGAAQTLLHRFRLRPGHHCLVVGADPLALAVAGELALLGSQVHSVVLPPPGPAAGELAEPREAIASVSRLADIAPSPFLRSAGHVVSRAAAAGAMGAILFPKQGIKVQGVPMALRRCVIRATGDDTVKGAVLADLTADGRVIAGSETSVDVDCICVSGDLYPLIETLEVAGQGGFASVEALGGRVPLYGPDMRVGGGLFVAGSASGVEGAQVAMAQGRLAGIGAAAFLGRVPPSELADMLEQAARDVETARREAFLTFRPGIPEGRSFISRHWPV